MKPLIAATVAAFFAGGVFASAALLAIQPRPGAVAVPAPAHPAWTQTAWPFPIDEWGTGKAFRCAAADCGAEINLYLRAKIGFCDCVNGVADDIELDRLTDFNLMGARPAVLGNGHAINVGWMKGRSRAYTVTGRGGAQSSALAIAFNDQCDALVATALLGHDKPALLEPAVITFLNGKSVLDWVKLTLDE